MGEYIPEKNNIIHKNLVDPKKILIPPLHLKLGLIKQFVKALNKDGNYFKYLFQKFPNISEAKIKEGVFNGPQVRTLHKDEHFVLRHLREVGVRYYFFLLAFSVSLTQ